MRMGLTQCHWQTVTLVAYSTRKKLCGEIKMQTMACGKVVCLEYIQHVHHFGNNILFEQLCNWLFLTYKMA